MKTIIIWKTPTCTRCPQVMRMLTEHEVPFEVQDLTTEENAKELDRFRNDLGIREAPIIEYGGTLKIGGFYGDTMDLIKQWKTDNATHAAGA